jgi:hypothetical protein
MYVLYKAFRIHSRPDFFFENLTLHDNVPRPGHRVPTYLPPHRITVPFTPPNLVVSMLTRPSHHTQ